MNKAYGYGFHVLVFVIPSVCSDSIIRLSMLLIKTIYLNALCRAERYTNRCYMLVSHGKLIVAETGLRVPFL